MPHDRQAILVFCTGDKELDAISIEAAKNLRIKWAIQGRLTRLGARPHFIVKRHCRDVICVSQRITDEFSALGLKSRLYIVGHGNWAKQTCCGLTGKDVADFLALHKLSSTVGLVSVVACGGAIGGSASDGPDYASLGNSAWSFTGQLHISLGIDHGIQTTCHGRVGNITVGKKGIHTATEIGRKGTQMYDPEGEPLGLAGGYTRSRRTESKICFYWDGKIQRQRWIDYGKTSDLHSAALALRIRKRPAA